MTRYVGIGYRNCVYVVTSRCCWTDCHMVGHTQSRGQPEVAFASPPNTNRNALLVTKTKTSIVLLQTEALYESFTHTTTVSREGPIRS